MKLTAFSFWKCFLLAHVPLILGFFFYLLILKGLSGTTAILLAQSHWVQTEKKALSSLKESLYLDSADELKPFYESLEVISGYELALLEILSESPDLHLIQEILIKNGNHEKDVAMMSYLVVFGKNLPPMDSALSSWRSANEEIFELQEIAKKVGVSLSEKKISAAEKSFYLKKIREKGTKIQNLENQFNEKIRESYEWLYFSTQLTIAIFFFVCSLFVLIVLKNTEKLFNRSAKEKRKFADVYEGLSKACIIAMTDENGVIVDVNDKFTEISGHTKKEILGKTHRFLNSGLHPKEFFKEMWSHIKNKQVWSGEICNQKKNGDLYWVDTTIIPILNKKNVYQYLALRFDITEKKLADQKLSQSAKMASLGEMAGGIAHEINNPLAIIRGRAQLTLRSLQVEKDSLSIPSVEKSIVKIIDTSHRIEKIIHSLRTISRDGAQDPFQTNSLENIINEALYLSEERIRSHNISFHLDNENSDLKFLKVDCRETQILQVLINLISNAIDALDEQQEKWIELKVVVLSPDNKVQIRLTDNGCGITENIQNQVWQPFFTTKEPGKGTGLGLSLSKSFIDSHHGDFYIDTKVKNTCFVIELPIKQPISIKGVA